MLKYIALAVIFIFILIIIASYKGLQVETQAPTSQSKKLEPEVKSTDLPTQAVEEIKSVAVSKEKAPAPETEVTESTLPNETNDPGSEVSDKETATVKRSQLIGGADVEWEEPEPRSPDNKFGEPPM